MYISTLASHLQLNSSIRSLQSQMMDAQKELSTGRKADLVAALRDRAAEDVDLRNALNDVTEFKGTAEVVASRMTRCRRRSAACATSPSRCAARRSPRATPCRDATSRNRHR